MPGRRPRQTELRLRIDAQPEYVATVRRTLEALVEQFAARANLLADLKTTVTEACMNSVRHAYPDGEGSIEVDAGIETSRLEVAVRDQGRGMDSAAVGERRAGAGPGLGLFLIRSLADQVEIRSKPRGGTEVRMWFELGGHDPDLAQRPPAPLIAAGS